MKLIAAGLFCIFLAGGCVKTASQPGEVSGFVPVYTPETVAKAIVFSAVAKPTENAGKILVIGNLLYQVETGAGVHVMDIANPASPVKKGFISVPGCQELAAKGSDLFVNNYNDLVVLTPTIAGGVTSVAVLRRVSNAFPAALNSLPTGTGIYFECPDPAKGYVSGWVRATIKNPKCRR